MRFIKLLLLFLLAPVVVQATTTFYAQSATGTASGADCADAIALPSSLAVSAGNIYIYCGTGTYAAGTSAALTLTGGGSSGNPAIFRFAHGAIMQAPYWGQNAAIRVAGSYITVDGSPTGTPCGYISGVDTACDGTIQATANGATLANHVAGGKGVWINGGLTGVVVQNVNFQNLFVPGLSGNANNETTASQFSGNTMCVYSDFTSQQITIQNNVCNNAHSMIRIGYQGTTGNTFIMRSNVFSNSGEGIWIGAGGSGSTIDGGGTISQISGNDFSNLDFDTVPFTTANSSCAAGANHQEFIHLFTQQTSSQVGTAAAPFQIAGNRFHGLLGCSFTSEIYIECDSAGQCGAPNHLFVDIFNNTIESTDPNSTLANNNGGNGMSECEGSTCRYINNTYYSNVGNGSSSNFAQHCESGSIVTLENDIFDGMNAALVQGGCGTITTATNLGFGLASSCGSTCSLSGNPLLNTTSVPPYQLSSTSSGAYQTGTNGSALGITGLTTDALGVARPSTGPWDLGAFEFFTGSGGSVTLTPATQNYGSVTIGNSSLTQVFTLSNTTASVLAGLTIGNVGGNAADFQISAGSTPCGASLATGASCTVNVLFHPSTNAAESTTLTASYTGGSVSSLLSGTGLNGTINLSSTALAFGNEIQYKLSPGQATTITNDTASAITVTGTPITGTNAADFSPINLCTVPLPTFGTCVVWGFFNPQQPIGTVEAGTLSINYTGFAGPPLTVSLAGTSTAGGPITSYAARTDLIPQPYNGGLGTIPCPGAGGCSSVIITNVTDNATTATFTCLVPCGFTPGQSVQINGSSLIPENALRTVLTDTGVSFTTAGVTTGSGTDGVASTGGVLTGAGTVIQSDFPNVTLIRVTDNLTPTAVGGATPGKNGFTVNPGSSETCISDVTNTRFVLTEAGETFKAFQLNPATNVITQLYGTQSFDPNGIGPICSKVTPFLFYDAAVIGSDLNLISIDTTSTTTAPTIANGGIKSVVDITATCGGGGVALPSNVISREDQVDVSVNDTIFGVLGQTTAGQNNTTIYMIRWNKITGECDVWNRQTGHWYLNGVDQGLVTIHALNFGTSYTADQDPESIHQMRMNQTGTYLWQTIESCLPSTPTLKCTSGGQNTAWLAGTATAYQDDIHQDPTAAGNHEAIGLNGVFYMRANCPSFCNANYSAPLTAGNTGNLLNFVPNDPNGLDAHPNYTNNLNDTSPYCMGHGQDNAAGLPQSFNPPYAWRNEIDCQSPVAPYPTYRITHTYVSTMAAAGFNAWATVIAASQDGKYLWMTTDWACMLGANDGVTATANCSNNGTYNGRADVFMVVMPPAGNLPVAPCLRCLVKNEEKDENERKDSLGIGSGDALLRGGNPSAEPAIDSVLLHQPSNSVQH